MQDRQEEISKFLSLVLRHRPDMIGVKRLKEGGWVDVDVLLKRIKRHGFSLTYEELRQLVLTSDKQRFAFSPDGKMIRANHGHSVDVVMELHAVKPPAVLYHGTVGGFMDSILAKGIARMQRQHVHLSATREEAKQVAARRGEPIILVIDAERMANEGFTFYQSENGVWLTAQVPPEYIREIVKSRLQVLIEVAQNGKDIQEILYGKFPVEIHKDCGEDEVKEILERLDRLYIARSKIEAWDGDSQDDIWRSQSGFSSLLEKLTAKYAALIATGLKSQFRGTRFYVSLALWKSPSPQAVDALIEYLRTDMSDLDREVAEKALAACKIAGMNT
jgi:putative RNA 2'-phosphotransferase